MGSNRVFRSERSVPRQTYQPSPLDTLTPEERSERMSRIKGQGSKPESIVRNMLRRLGCRYRLQYRKLPGKPDFAFPGRRKVIWVHGCFWHRHDNCHLARFPKGRQDFWVPKLEGNRLRDLANEETVVRMGWKVLVVWECELRHLPVVESTLRDFLEINEIG